MDFYSVSYICWSKNIKHVRESTKMAEGMDAAFIASEVEVVAARHYSRIVEEVVDKAIDACVNSRRFQSRVHEIVREQNKFKVRRGTVTRVCEKHYGFLRSDGKSIFFHFSAIVGDPFCVGDEVSFVADEGDAAFLVFKRAEWVTLEALKGIVCKETKEDEDSSSSSSSTSTRKKKRKHKHKKKHKKHKSK